ncbi:glycosyltransferase [Mycolicibacterium litorale]|uniref:glycosyltransferase n=1 Tax=Mycolicibacterium litorale TaxID=758802 RepID=UPI003CFB31DC
MTEPQGASSSRHFASPKIIAFPMHGYHKMVDEGFRTRDAHLIEWLAKFVELEGTVEVLSRPEPKILDLPRRFSTNHRRTSNKLNLDDHSSTTWRLPHPTDRRRWWVDSASHYDFPRASAGTPAVVWNPFVAVSNISHSVFNSQRRTIADLLDDWTVHYAFARIRDQVEDAYRHLFSYVDHVTANSEGTAELARRFGRSDVELMTNGVDPERFDATSAATGPMTVGYVGKIGHRLDLDLVCAAARLLSSVNFVFAGPILDSGYREPMERHPNITLLGDVHYEDVPALLRTFDIGWVPHRVGEFEIGGDILKTYEYRAAGLPVLTTPVRGAGKRGLAAVHVADAQDHPRLLKEFAHSGPRVARDSTPIPIEHTWEAKARHLYALAGIS